MSARADLCGGDQRWSSLPRPSVRFFFAYNASHAPPWQTRSGRIRASLDTPCPHCGHSITPEERTHVDTKHLECPQCKKRFIPGLSSRQNDGERYSGQVDQGMAVSFGMHLPMHRL